MTKVDKLVALDKVDDALRRILRQSYRGYFRRQDIDPLMRSLEDALRASPVDKKAIQLFNRIRMKVQYLTNDAPMVIEDVWTSLYGTRNNYDDLPIRKPKSIREYVILKRREILGIVITKRLNRNQQDSTDIYE